MDKNEIVIGCIITGLIICGTVLMVNAMDNYPDPLESPEKITIVCGTDTLSPVRTELQNITYYKHRGCGGFDIKYINRTGSTAELNIRHDYSIDIENGHLIIYL